MAKGEYLQYGGQAIIEGVMMRSPNFFAIACRAPNKEIVLVAEPLEKTWIGRQKWLKLPFLRGSWALLDAMTLGTRALNFAASVQTDYKYLTDEEQAKMVKDGYDPAMPERQQKIQDRAVMGAIIISLLFGFALFKLLPQAVATYAQRTYSTSDQITNLITELVKISLFLGYLSLISLMPTVQEVFKYHGAEHKAINVLEADQDLTMENCMKQTRLHPRCGTSFAIIVLLLGLIIFVIVPRIQTKTYFGDVFANFFLHVAILPIIAGIAYELLRFAGKFRDSKFVNMLFFPGLMTQYITTKEPREDQIEVALESLKACMEEERKRAAQTATA